jgi:hypothetical protein
MIVHVMKVFQNLYYLTYQMAIDHLTGQVDYHVTVQEMDI